MNLRCCLLAGEKFLARGCSWGTLRGKAPAAIQVQPSHALETSAYNSSWTRDSTHHPHVASILWLEYPSRAIVERGRQICRCCTDVELQRQLISTQGMSVCLRLYYAQAAKIANIRQIHVSLYRHVFYTIVKAHSRTFCC